MTSVHLPNSFGIATLKWTLIPAGKQISVTMGFFDALLSNDATAYANTFKVAATGAGSIAEAPAMYNAWRFDGVSTLFRNSSGFLTVGTSTGTVTGSITATANGQPIYSPLVVSKYTANAGREQRGRMYPPMTLSDETAVDQLGNIIGTTVTLWQGRYGVFLAALQAVSVALPRLLHTDPSLAPTPISSLVVKPVIGSQRRRRARGA